MNLTLAERQDYAFHYRQLAVQELRHARIYAQTLMESIITEDARIEALAEVAIATARLRWAERSLDQLCRQRVH